MFRHRRARESFGILSKLPWETAKKDKRLKQLAREKNRIAIDEYGQQWVESYVEWFVRRVCLTSPERQYFLFSQRIGLCHR
jgi:hypothetical protein